MFNSSIITFSFIITLLASHLRYIIYQLPFHTFKFSQQTHYFTHIRHCLSRVKISITSSLTLSRTTITKMCTHYVIFYSCGQHQLETKVVECAGFKAHGACNKPKELKSTGAEACPYGCPS
ncbi:hypothetical protein MFRU_002g02670 [Monilinia fructicola]|nr:hypothetical protein MFRU_002g02670 [Monilinia fructicola]